MSELTDFGIRSQWRESDDENFRISVGRHIF